jgi:hypothetical protein
MDDDYHLAAESYVDEWGLNSDLDNIVEVKEHNGKKHKHIVISEDPTSYISRSS